MPAYNAGRYINDALNSISGQSYENLEIIVVNDGSADNTADVLERYTDARIKVYHQANLGQSVAANNAFRFSTGSLIKFMDADDLISQNFIENQVNRLNTATNKIVSARWGRFYNDDLNSFKLVQDEKISIDLTPAEWLTRAWQNADAMMQCALWLIPRSIIEKSGLWDESLSLINDLDFFTRVLLSGEEILFEPDAVVYYRSGNKNSLSGTKTPRAVLSAFHSIEKATMRLCQSDSSVRARIACANLWQNFVYDIYPDHKNLVNTALKKIDELGGSTLSFPAGGYTALLQKVIGWKAVKQIKMMLPRK